MGEIIDAGNDYVGPGIGYEGATTPTPHKSSWLEGEEPSFEDYTYWLGQNPPMVPDMYTATDTFGDQVTGYRLRLLTPQEVSAYRPDMVQKSTPAPTQTPLPNGAQQSYVNEKGQTMVWSPELGDYVAGGYSPTNTPATPLSASDSAYFDLQNKQFEYQKQKDAADAAAAKDKLLADTSAQGPGAWLKVAQLQGVKPVAQPFMFPLMQGDYKQWIDQFNNYFSGQNLASSGNGGAASPTPTTGAVQPGQPGLNTPDGSTRQVGTGTLEQGPSQTNWIGTLPVQEQTKLTDLNTSMKTGATPTGADSTVAKQWLPGSYDSTLAKTIDANKLWGTLPSNPGESTTDYYSRLVDQPTAPVIPPPEIPYGGQIDLPPGYEQFVGMADGGKASKMMNVIVGEEGPEFAKLAPGSEIIPMKNMPRAADGISNWGGSPQLYTEDRYVGTPTPTRSTLPGLMNPSRQYQARMGPSANAMLYAYEQMRTGATPEEQQWRLWSMAPPSGANPGLQYRR